MDAGFPAAHEAVEAHDLDGLTSALAEAPSLLTSADDEGRTLLSIAAANLVSGDWSRPPRPADDPEGHRLTILRALLDAGADVTTSYGEGWTPLHGAAYTGHAEAVQMLLDHGASLESCAYGDGGTPLMQALFWGHRDVAELLAAAGGPIQNLRCAAGVGDLEAMERFFDSDGALLPAAGAHRAYYRPHEGFPEWTPSQEPQEVLDEALSLAARSGRVEALPSLVDRGACVDAAPYAGSALHWAVLFDREEAVTWLLDRGADVNSRAGLVGQGGGTPLHAAAWAENVALARLLVDRGADPSLQDEEHTSTPWGYATFRGAKDVVRFLEEIGAGA